MAGPRIYPCTWTLLGVMAPVEAAQFAADNGFQGLEICCDPINFWPGVTERTTIDTLAAIRDQEGIGYTLYGPPTLNAASPLPEVRRSNDETVKRSVDLAERLGSPVLCVHPGVVDELSSLERKGVPFETERFDREHLLRQGWERAVDAISRWAEIAAPAGITIMVENEVHTHHTAAPTAEAVAAMVEAMGGSNVRVNFDTGHAYVGAGLEAEFGALKEHIGHFHLNDNKRKVSDHLPLGEGAVDFPSIAGFMATVDAALVIEIYAPKRAVTATLASRDYLLGLFEAG